MNTQTIPPLPPKSIYYKRIRKNISIALGVIAICLIIGVVGYHFFSDMPWIDALHNAAMILSGMGLVDVNKVSTNGAKIFSSFYALFSGIVFITNMGLILSPTLHRVLHRFHIQDK
ncbi:MAG TPA: hypothetical protein PK275_06945 [Chitinophagaceae bacterium]|jgi:hypothetical protein|nr:hypothetical protein [Chitinophagaceae bacterium]